MPSVPVLVGQRIKAVRRMTVAEQSDFDLPPSRERPLIIELDSGVKLYIEAGRGWYSGETFTILPSGVEVVG